MAKIENMLCLMYTQIFSDYEIIIPTSPSSVFNSTKHFGFPSINWHSLKYRELKMLCQQKCRSRRSSTFNA